MSSNYPPGSMRGSGIYSDETTLDVWCRNNECDFEGEVEVSVDDDKQGHWTCTKCGTEQELDLAEHFGPDPDDAYDRARDERDGY